MPRARMRSIVCTRRSDDTPRPRQLSWVATLPIPPSRTAAPRRRIVLSKTCTHATTRPTSSASRKSP